MRASFDPQLRSVMLTCSQCGLSITPTSHAVVLVRLGVERGELTFAHPTKCANRCHETARAIGASYREVGFRDIAERFERLARLAPFRPEALTG
jgi:hypothetical protein